MYWIIMWGIKRLFKVNAPLPKSSVVISNKT
jgi:hypothetical protein